MTERNNRRNADPREARTVRNVNEVKKDNKISWGAIIAGGISFAAVFTVLSLLITALGLGIFSPNNENPIQSMSIGVGIATAVVLLISFYVSGFITGAFSRGQAKLHSFMSWALSILLLFGVVTSMISSALGIAGKAVGNVASGVGNVASDVADTAANGANKIFDGAVNSMEDVDTEQLEADINNALKETDVEQLQPDYLKNQLDESKDEIVEAGKDILVNPENSDKIIDNLTKSLEDRAKNITDSVDKKTIEEEVYKNTDLSQEESEEAVDNIYEGLDKASKEASTQLANAEKEVKKAKKEANQKVEEAKDDAEDASNKASAGSVIAFIFLIIGLVIEAAAAKKGSQYVNR